MTAERMYPSMYKSGIRLYVCLPQQSASKCTNIKIYNTDTGELKATLSAVGIVTDFQAQVIMNGNAPWGSGNALCDAFTFQDEVNGVSRLQGVNTTTHNWWCTDQWGYN